MSHPVDPVAATRIRRVPTTALTPPELDALRSLLWSAFESHDEDDRMTEADWEHALGGTHVVLEVSGEIAGHAAVVERTLWIGDRPLRTGYVEAVAIAPAFQRRGLGSAVMRDVNELIRDGFELGALGTGVHSFYERLGWLTWQGATSVRTTDGEQRTADEDGYILVLETPRTGALDLGAPIACEWRPGDVW